MPPEQLLEDMVDKMSARMPDEQRAQFVELDDEAARRREGRTARCTTAMAKHFTADELRALADFYGSPARQVRDGKFGATWPT
jgi:hypothetical protein